MIYLMVGFRHWQRLRKIRRQANRVAKHAPPLKAKAVIAAAKAVNAALERLSR